MTSPFDWQSKPSEIAAALQPSPMTRKAPKKPPVPLYGITKTERVLRDRFQGAYGRAKVQA